MKEALGRIPNGARKTIFIGLRLSTGQIFHLTREFYKSIYNLAGLLCIQTKDTPVISPENRFARPRERTMEPAATR